VRQNGERSEALGRFEARCGAVRQNGERSEALGRLEARYGAAKRRAQRAVPLLAVRWIPSGMTSPARNDVPPDTLSVDLTPDGVEVEYKDGRSAFYRGVPQKAGGSVRTAPGKDVHVLVTDETETQGVLVYVNDLNTHDDILESSGVGRLMLEPGERSSLFPGVEAENEQHRIVVDVDFGAADGRVFVFEEDEMGERSFEIVAEDGPV
jgi:hypothetical protein